ASLRSTSCGRKTLRMFAIGSFRPGVCGTRLRDCIVNSFDDCSLFQHRPCQPATNGCGVARACQLESTVKAGGTAVWQPKCPSANREGVDRSTPTTGRRGRKGYAEGAKE